jgi:hypothetical protein
MSVIPMRRPRAHLTGSAACLRAEVAAEMRREGLLRPSVAEKLDQYVMMIEAFREQHDTFDCLLVCRINQLADELGVSPHLFPSE